MPTPADNVSQIPSATAPNADSTGLGSFPNLARVAPSDPATPEVANRQEAALEARTETLRSTVNQLVGVVNQLDTWFVRRDGSAQKDANSGFQGDVTFNSHRALGLPAPVDPTEPLRLADLSLLPNTLPTQAPQTLLGNTLGIAAQPTAITPAQTKALLGLSYAAATNVDNHFTVNQTVNGVVTANTFAGSGASLTSVPAASLTGVVAPARLPTFTRDASGVVPPPGGTGAVRYLREDMTWTDVSATSGVQSFNGRAGDVLPQTGDYTAAQVGALPNVNIAPHTVLANPTGSPALPVATTLGASLEFTGTSLGVTGATYPLHASGERLAIFYHDLTQVNGLTDPVQIAHFFTDNYDALVMVWLLNLPTSPSYAQTVAVVNEIKRTRPEFCLIGYVHMGETIAPIHSVADIELYIDQWATLHCDGIFMDECEYGFQTPRSKINAVLAYLHQKTSNAGRRMFGLVNCWSHAELIEGSVDATYNPTGVGADFAPGDALFHESLTYHYAYVFGSGGYDNYISAAFLWSKEAAGLTLRNTFGLHYYGSSLLPTSGGSAGTGTPIATESQIKQIWQDCASGARLLGADAFCLTYEGYSGGGVGSITPREITYYPRSLAYADRVEPSPRLVAVTEDVGGTPTITKIVRGPLTYISYLPAAGPALHYFVDPAVPASIPTELRFVTTENAVNKAPSAYPNVALGAELKQSATIGIPTSADFFAGLVTMNQWSDSSGGHILQMGWTDLGPYWRLGAIGGATWSGWNPMGLSPIGTVVAGSYTAANVTVDAYGRITSVANGSVTTLPAMDTRSVNATPLSYAPQTLNVEFKQKSVVGITGGADVYGGVMTFKPWNDGSGGKATQIGMSDAGITVRRAPNDAASWGAWNTVAYQDADNAFSVKQTFGGAEPVAHVSNTVSTGGGALWVDKYVQMNTSAAVPAFAPGRRFWDAANRCMATMSDIAGSTLQEGYEFWVRIYNNTGATLADGKVVYIDGASNGWPTASLAISDATDRSQRTLGVMTSTAAAGAEGIVTKYGIVHGINTSAFAVGAAVYVSTAVAGALTDVPPEVPNHIVRVGYVTESAVNGSIFVDVASGTDYMSVHPSHGFVNRTDSTLSFTNATRVFQIAPTATSYSLWRRGIEDVTTTTKTVTIPDVTGLYFIYLDTAKVLRASLTPWDLGGTDVPVATLYWYSPSPLVAAAYNDERHGFQRNVSWHKWAHLTVGTRYASGLAGTFTNTTLSVTQGTIHDEDIVFDTASTRTNCRLWRYSSVNAAMHHTIETNPYAHQVGVLQYDAAGVLTDVSNNNYVINDVYAVTDPVVPIYIRVGTAQYNTLAQAQAAMQAATASWQGLALQEMKLCYRVIYRNQGGTATFIQANDFRTVSTLGGSVSGGLPPHASTHSSTGSDPITSLGAITIDGAPPTSVATGWAAIGGSEVWLKGGTNYDNDLEGTTAVDEIKLSGGAGYFGYLVQVSDGFGQLSQLEPDELQFFTPSKAQFAYISFAPGGTPAESSLDLSCDGGINISPATNLTVVGGVDPDSSGVNNATTIGRGIFITKREQYTGGPQLRTTIDGGIISCQDTIQVKGPESYDAELLIHGYGIDFVGYGSIGISGNYGGLYISSPTGIDLIGTTYIEGTAPTSVDTGTIVLGGGEGWFAGSVYSGSLVLSRSSGKGIKVDTETPTYPWRDLRDELVVRATGAAAPAYSQVGSTVFYDYEFVGVGTQRKEARCRYHIDHDYAPGTDLHFHVHWYPATAAAGNVKWYAAIAYAKGHNQAAFNFTTPINVSVVQAAPGVQYQHMIAEVVISQSGAGSLLNNTLIEPDGILEVMFYRDPADAEDTYGASVYVPYADCHYQSTGIGTKQKSPNFWSG